MSKHRGEIVEAIVRASGYSIKSLSERLSVSRNTVYNKFKQYDLSYEFIVRVGDIIHYDFTTKFPEIKNTFDLGSNQGAAELWRLEQKYTRLLERYNALLTFLIKLSNDHDIERIRGDMNQLFELSP